MDNLQYYKSLYDAGLIASDYATPEQKAEIEKMSELPENAFKDTYARDASYLIYEKANLPADKIQIMILSKVLSELRTIRGCVVFFTVIAALALLLSFIGLFS